MLKRKLSKMRLKFETHKYTLCTLILSVHSFVERPCSHLLYIALESFYNECTDRIPVTKGTRLITRNGSEPTNRKRAKRCSLSLALTVSNVSIGLVKPPNVVERATENGVGCQLFALLYRLTQYSQHR